MKTKRTRIFALLLIAVLALGMNACGAGGGDEIYVQSVASLNGMGSLGFADRFAGVVQAGKTVELRLDEEMKLDEIRVEEGQAVKKGDVLFTYNNEAAALRVDQAKLEIEQKKNEITALQEEIESLSVERSYASADRKLSYTLEIQSREADIRETQYDISVKEKELKELEKTVSETQVKSEVDGRVTQINRNSTEYYGDGTERPFMTVIETVSLRVKGEINELNRGMLTEGQAVTVYSRTDETQTWQGTIQTIDWENAEQGDQSMKMMGYYGGSDEMTTSSRYPFYITLEDSEGLLIGQHVYIEPGAAAEADDALYLPDAFVEAEENAYYVWAANARDKLERRGVSLSETDDGTGRYKIEDGLTAGDYIAFPDGTLQEGMSVIRTEEDVLDLIDGQDFEGEAAVSDDVIVFDGAEAPDGAEDGEAAENAEKDAAEKDAAEEKPEEETEAETAAAASEG